MRTFCGSEYKPRRLKSLACAFVILLCVSGIASAQNTVGAILGTVSSSDGAPISNASITVTNEETHATRHITSDEKGQYIASDLDPGTYSVSGSATGFGSFLGKEIVLRAQQTIRIDIPLKVGNVTTRVEVTAGEPVIETEMPSISTTVSSTELTKSSSNLLGIVDSTGDSGILYYTPLLPTGHVDGSNKWSMAGSTSGEAFYNVDGISSNTAIYGNAEGPSFPSFEIIGEVHYADVDNKAEMGQLVNITVSTKSGTDHYHGAVFEHFQDQDLLARSFFQGGPYTAFTDHDFGAGIGGPILRNRFYFYGSYEGLHDSQPASINDSIPTQAFRTGDFSSLLGSITIKNPYTGLPFVNNQIFDTPADALLLQTSQSLGAQKWQTMFYPSPNQGGPTSYSNNLVGVYPIANIGERIDGRIDANLTSTNSAFVRMSYDRAAPTNLYSGFPPSITGFEYQDRKTFSGVLSDTWVIKPTLYNLLKVGVMWSNNDFRPLLAGQPIINALGIQGYPIAPPNAVGYPKLSISGFSSPSYQGPANGTDQTVQVTDQVTYERSKHAFKAGFEYRPQLGTLPSYRSFGSQSFNGNYTGFAYADFLLGLPVSTSYNYIGPTVYATQYFTSAFAQDDWRLTPKLTLSYGVRYDFQSTGSDKGNNVSMFDPANGAIVVPSLKNANTFLPPGFPSQIPIISAQQAGLPAGGLRNSFKHGFYPRLGFAYQVNDKTVVRGGYGVYNNDLTIHLFADLYQAPYGGSVTYTNPASLVGATPQITFTNPINSGGGSLGSINITGIDKNLRAPFTQQWNLTGERDLGFNTGLRLSYIGLMGSLLYTKNLNQVPASATIPYSLANAAFPNFQTVNYISHGGGEFYNAFTAEVTHHMKRNLQFESALTIAHNRTDDPDNGDIEAGVTAEDAYNLQRQTGNDPYTPRFQFVSNLLYTLPIGPGGLVLTSDNFLTRIVGGWQVSTAYLANTGNYLTPIFKGHDPAHINASSGSVSLNPGVSSKAVGTQSITNWFNPLAYAIPAAGQFGNAGYGILKGPDSQAMNAGLFKSFPVWRETKLEISGTFTNVLNHPNFSTPDVTITDAPQSVGHITGTQGSFFGPRSGLVSARYTF
jgi:hypothetical protein